MDASFFLANNSIARDIVSQRPILAVNKIGAKKNEQTLIEGQDIQQSGMWDNYYPISSNT